MTHGREDVLFSIIWPRVSEEGAGSPRESPEAMMPGSRPECPAPARDSGGHVL